MQEENYQQTEQTQSSQTDQPTQESTPISEEASPQPKKSGTGLQSNIAGALAYVLGPVTGIVFLLIEPEDKFVRFHAMQSTILGIAVFVISVALSFFDFLGLLSIPLNLAAFALWIVLIYKAYNNEEWKLPIIGDMAKEQIG
ncbi:hypothetical protein B5M47_00910 [candidate division CPR3 bacterium 4484_211]|uniref:DUF4870 domain-containing protein n=1 Tax=candidate division CPR3 bacterium 4484_211 TaxID=1968527 RepID=A0A1W9NZH7_UNCC3|nr:MAG: hypothetical protein B5M47_00910 [candidate division CPR3 bacterium 4484_211]